MNLPVGMFYSSLVRTIIPLETRYRKSAPIDAWFGRLRIKL